MSPKWSFSTVFFATLLSTTTANWWSSLAVGFTPTNDDFLDADVLNDNSLNSTGNALQPWKDIPLNKRAMANEPLCNQLNELSTGQRRMCDLFVDHMPQVGNGARHAIDECQWQFKDDLWNCTSPLTRVEAGPVHDRGTREAAFTYAIVAAGVTHQLARACRKGQMDTCGCSMKDAPKQMQSYEWGGCGDNLEYGYEFAKNFIDVREKEEKFASIDKRYGQSLMNRWNNEAGRMLLKRQTKPRCKCHGVSGSCEVKTCWMEMPSIRDVGDLLAAKYKHAIRVKVNQRGNLQQVAPLGLGYRDVGRGRATKKEPEEQDEYDDEEFSDENGAIRRRRTSRRRKHNRNTRSVRKHDLIYIDDSPDYCVADSKTSAGTRGRVCDPDGVGQERCDILCCGNGWNEIVEETVSKCNCNFQWCCQVVCEQCREVKKTHVCK